MQQSSIWADTSLENPESKQERDYALSLGLENPFPAQLPVRKQVSEEEYAFHISLFHDFRNKDILNLGNRKLTKY